MKVAGGVAFVFVFALVALARVLAAPNMTMHQTQAGTLDSDGWTSAKSTDGRFTAELPCRYNDFTFADEKGEGPVRRSFTVGCERANGSKFLVTRFEYRDGADAGTTNFNDIATGNAWPGAKIARGSVNGRASVDVVIVEPDRCGFVRVLKLDVDNVMLVVEASSSACEGLDAPAKRFFASLQTEP